jgi:TonB family protein
MLHIDAESKGKECRLKEGKSMRIGFPRKKGQRDMKLFTGERESDGGMDWKLEAENDLNRTYSKEELDEKASFPGGAESKAGYIRERTSYPATAQAQGREGIVRVGAEIARDGSLEDLVLLDSVAPSLNRSAFETVRNMPPWIPAQKGEQRVRSRTTIEVRFSLGKGFEEEEDPEPLSPKELEEKMENGGKIAEASREAVSDYLFQSSKMRGWHNCDRFLEELQFKEYTVELEEVRDADVRIFFPEGKSFLNAKGEGTRYRFEQVPRNEEIRVIAIKDAEEGYGLAIKSTNSRKEDPELNFEKVGMEDLKAAMEELNGI